MDRATVTTWDSDGVAVTAVGTAAFALAWVAGLIGRGWLRTHGHGWWLDVAAAGFALGIVGLGYCVRRRARARIRAS